MSNMCVNANAKIKSSNIIKTSIMKARIIFGIISIIDRIIGSLFGLQPVPIRILSRCPRYGRGNRKRTGKRA